MASRAASPDEANIRTLVDTFYDRIRRDDMLGPIFDQVLAGRWDQHLPKMYDFWSNIVLGTKRFRGNVMQAHMPLQGLRGEHFNRWLYLFLDTVNRLYEPAAAAAFMTPALRIAQSLQLGLFGWDYVLPPEQQALLARLNRPAQP